MLLRLEGEVAHVADRALDPVEALVRAVRHVIGRQVRLCGQQRVELGADRLVLGFGRRDAVLQRRDLGHHRGGVAALGLHLADLAREVVALGLRLLELGLRRPPLLVELQDLRRERRQPAPFAPPVKRRGIVPNPLQIKHASAPSK